MIPYLKGEEEKELTKGRPKRAQIPEAFGEEQNGNGGTKLIQCRDGGRELSG